MTVPVEAKSRERTASRPESGSRRTVQRVSMMKRKAVVDYGIDYGLHNMHGTAGLYYVSNPVSCIIRGGRPRLRRCAEFRSRMTSDRGCGNMARAKEKQPTSSTPAAATTIVSDLASLCAAGLLCNCSCQDV